MVDRFELPAELNIYSALETRDNLRDWLAKSPSKSHEPLEVSARDVTVVDASGLQVLAALANGNQAWRLVEASAIFADACRTLGLAQWLDSRHTKIEGASA